MAPAYHWSCKERSWFPRTKWETTTVEEVAEHDGPVADITWNLGTALKAMETADIDRLPVLCRGGFVGLITTGEILKLDEILDQAEGLTA